MKRFLRNALLLPVLSMPMTQSSAQSAPQNEKIYVEHEKYIHEGTDKHGKYEVDFFWYDDKLVYSALLSRGDLYIGFSSYGNNCSVDSNNNGVEDACVLTITKDFGRGRKILRFEPWRIRVRRRDETSQNAKRERTWQAGGIRRKPRDCAFHAPAATVKNRAATAII